MKSKLLIALVIGFVSGTVLAEDVVSQTNAPSPFRNEKEKMSYAAGMSVGTYYKRAELELDVDKLVEGIRDVFSGNPTLLTEQQMREVLMEGQRQAAAKREEKRKQQAEENKKKAEAFLAENKTKPGVVSTESGLQYRIITEGDGPKPGPNDMVTVNYRGTLIDGTEFDSSYKHGRPATFAVNGVIKGWSEALQMMKVGSKWELFIPPELAYGEFGQRNIPPNSALIFEVELLTNTPPGATPPAATPKQPLTSDIIKVPSLEEMKKGAKIETIKAEDLEKEIKKQESEKAAEKKE